MILDSRSRWLALLIVCLGDLMIVLDVTIVGVALPSIREDLGFSETSLAWVVNAYLLTFGGFLLLGGRLGDLFGHRRLFVIGVALFTSASLACGLAGSQAALIGARAVQGLGGAIVSAVALSLIVTLFTEPGERAKAMGVFGFVAAGGGSIGVLLGGILTDALAWNWIFLVNVPIGIAVVALSFVVLPGARGTAEKVRLDVAGAVAVTASLMVAVYAIVNGNEVGWTTSRTLGLLAIAAAISPSSSGSSRASTAPLVPLGSSASGTSLSRTSSGCSGRPRCSPGSSSRRCTCNSSSATARSRSASRSFPATSSWRVFSLGLSARIVMRFGIRKPLGVGLGLAAIGLLLFARAPVDGTFAVDVLPSMILLGIGAGHGVQPGAPRCDGRRPPARGGARVRGRQHRIHDGRGARPGGAREPRGVAHGRRSRSRAAATWPRSRAATTPPSSSVRSSPRARRCDRRVPAAARGRGCAARRGERGARRRGGVRYGTYCWSIEQTVSTFTAIQTPVSRPSNSSTGFSPATSWASWSTVTLVAPKFAGSPCLREHRHMSVGRDEIGEEPMPFLDLVVVVGHRLPGLDDAVFRGRLVRGHATREPCRVEAHPVQVAVALQRRDVAVRAVTAGSSGRRGVRVVRKVEAGEDRGGQSCRGRNACQDDDGDLHGLSRASVARSSVNARREE